MSLSLECKKAKRTGFIPAFLCGGILAAAVPIVNMAVRSEMYLGQQNSPMQILAFSLYGTSGSSYTLETREVLRLLYREFVYVGDPVPELNEQEHAAFLMNIQKSILLSLEKRKLLTHSQRERCLVELEKQYSREQKSRRRA